ncbi:MAG: hypothetical protein HY744_27080 [Deltaproteobacteria bacterium]|nr:hypothetical protein [Deltaproteobacteria bacterium]
MCEYMRALAAGSAAYAGNGIAPGAMGRIVLASHGKFDFYDAAGGNTHTIVLLRNFDSSHVVSAALELAVEQITMPNGTCSLAAYNCLLVADQPQTDYVSTTALGTLTIPAGTSAGYYGFTALTGVFGGNMRVVLKYTEGALNAGSRTITLTANLLVRPA